MADDNVFIEQVVMGTWFVKLKKVIYERDAVLLAADKYTDQCYVKIDALDDGYVGVWFKLRYSNDEELVQRLLSDFCNEVLDQQVRLDLEKRYGHLRDVIYNHAFKPIGGIDNKGEKA